jgi:hypothetical protein
MLIHYMPEHFFLGSFCITVNYSEVVTESKVAASQYDNTYVKTSR